MRSSRIGSALQCVGKTRFELTVNGGLRKRYSGKEARHNCSCNERERGEKRRTACEESSTRGRDHCEVVQVAVRDPNPESRPPSQQLFRACSERLQGDFRYWESYRAGVDYYGSASSSFIHSLLLSLHHSSILHRSSLSYTI